MKFPIKVAFVCLGNSCRSQMAEAFARKRYPKLLEPVSAGITPALIIQPETIECMREKGISLDGQRPKPLDDIPWNEIEVVVNLSGAPLLGLIPDYKGHNLMWPVQDPIGRSRKMYSQVRDRIEHLVGQLAEMLRGGTARGGS